MNVSQTDGSSYGIPLRDVDSLPEAVSDDFVVRMVGAAFARLPLDVGEVRDIRLIAFVLDVSSRLVSSDVQKAQPVKSPAVVVDDQLGSLAGLSTRRVERAVSRLLETQILERIANDPPQWFRFSRAVIQPIGSDQYIDWAVVIRRMAGHGPAVLLLRAVLDLVVVPWEWTRLTYEQLAVRAAYSLGMAQRGVAQLLELGILERANHSGRGHDYRFTAWALGRGPAVISESAFSGAALSENAEREKTPTPGRISISSAPKEAGTSTMAVEIGGLVLRVPIGTEIRMTVGPDGEMQYQVGSELRITPRG